MNLPKSHRPELTGPDAFCGPAQVCAGIITKIAAAYMPTKTPAMLLYHGFPGTAKSSLSKWTVKAFGVDPLNLTDLSGVELTVDRVQRIAEDLRMPSFYPGYRAIRIEEIDTMPRVAQVRFLKLCDDVADGRFQNSNGTLIVASCNTDVESMEPRFQSRFQPFEIKGPDKQQAVDFIVRMAWADPTTAEALVKGHLEGIAAQQKTHPDMARCDLRAVLNDLTGMMVCR